MSVFQKGEVAVEKEQLAGWLDIMRYFVRSGDINLFRPALFII